MAPKALPLHGRRPQSHPIQATNPVCMRRVAARCPEATILSCIRVYGGWRRLRGGDVNQGVRNSALLTASNLYSGTYPLKDGDVAELNRGTEYGADLVFHLTPRLGLVVGAGRIESFSEGQIEIRSWSSERARARWTATGRLGPRRTPASVSVDGATRVDCGSASKLGKNGD